MLFILLSILLKSTNSFISFSIFLEQLLHLKYLSVPNSISYFLSSNSQIVIALLSTLVIDSNINIKKAGTYEVTYSVVDSYGNKTVKTVKAIVKERENKNGLFMYNEENDCLARWRAK